jgi:hypothetical protein
MCVCVCVCVCVYIYTHTIVTCKTVNSRYPQGTGLRTSHIYLLPSTNGPVELDYLQDNSSARTPRKTPPSLVKKACLQLHCLVTDISFPCVCLARTAQETQFPLYCCHVLSGGYSSGRLHSNGRSSIAACFPCCGNVYGHPSVVIGTAHTSVH